MAGWVKALLFLLGGVVAAGGTAYVTGLLDPWFAPKPAVVASVPETAPEPAAPGQEPAVNDEAGDEAGDEATEEAAPGEVTQDDAGQADETIAAPKQDRLASPVFDVLRVEPDGSLLVAGKAGARAAVELLSDVTVLGSATAGEEGDFVIVLDERLAPGDYRLALRATMPGDQAMLSAETAIVSVPQVDDGQVLAMIEEPGAPAQLVTVPQVEPEASAAQPETSAGQPSAPRTAGTEAAEEKAEEKEGPALAGDAGAAATPEAAEPGEEAAAAVVATGPDGKEAPAAPQPAATATVVVEAVEIEGDTVFVAGRAVPGHTVRVYADALFLGDAVVSDGGRFLVEAKRDLAVGNYMIRADLIDKDGGVLARAAVPFEREPGETIAAVAPAAPATTPAAPSAMTPAAGGGEEPAAPLAATTDETATAADEASAPAPGEEPATAAPLQRADGAVIIRRGDSLWRISRRVYGHGIRYSTIYLANQDQISDPDRIWPGQVFALPHETPEGEQADLDAIGDQSVEPGEPRTDGE